MVEKPKVTIYYDGLCHLCSREMNHYKKINHDGILNFVDITSQDFDAKALGLDPEKVNEVMHVKTSEGEIKTEIEAFLTIWKEFPQYRRLSQVVGFKPLRPFFTFSYRFFAKHFRPRLPKKRNAL